MANWKISCFSASNNCVCEMVQQRQTYNTCGMRSIFHLEYWHPEVWFIVGSVALGGGRFVRCFFWLPVRYIARKRVEDTLSYDDLYVASLSPKTIVYKAC